MPRASVLVVDDHAEMVSTLANYLADYDWQVASASGGDEAIDRFAREPTDVVLTDVRMKGLDGLDVLFGIHKIDPQVPVVLMTAFGKIESAVDAIQRGAYHYVTKPFKMTTVRVLLERAAQERLLRQQNRHLRAAFHERFAAHGLLGVSPGMRELNSLIDRVASSTSPVLIVGETGTGKELVAKAIHVESGRRDAPFVAANCAALPEPLLDSELFGHVPGAFPGALQASRGLFVEADGGTLLLDEVGGMSLAVQAKLLRVLQSGEIRPVGGEGGRRVDVRCIASTHDDLQALVRQRTFREDLFFRLNVLPVRVPALRERREDIPVLVNHFLEQAQARTGVPNRRRLSAPALKALEAYRWPGNVRELENIIQRLVVTAASGEISVEAVRAALVPIAPEDPIEALATAGVKLDQLEDRYIAAVLRQTRGNKVDAAAVLGVDLSTLYRRAKQRRS
jgi:two-component system response regulator HydG